MTEIDMSKATRYKGRDGKEYEKVVVSTVLIPEEFKGKYLRVDSTSGELVYIKSVGLSAEDKAKRKAERDAVNAKKKADKAKLKAESVAKGSILRKAITNAKVALKKDLTNVALQNSLIEAEKSYVEFKKSL